MLQVMIFGMIIVMYVLKVVMKLQDLLVVVNLVHVSFILIVMFHELWAIWRIYR